MVADRFTILLEELGGAMDLKLAPDKNDSCLIHLKGGINLQLELDKNKKNLILCTDFGEIPQGGYRTSLFEEALKANSMEYPRYGTFAFSRQADHLVMFKSFPLENLTGLHVADYIERFKEKANKWQTAIKEDRVPTFASEIITGKNRGMFGLTP